MERIIIKYITNEASLVEIEVLTSWLGSQENKELFREYVRVNHIVDSALSTYDSTDVKVEISKRIQNEEHKL